MQCNDAAVRFAHIAGSKLCTYLPDQADRQTDRKSCWHPRGNTVKANFLLHVGMLFSELEKTSEKIYLNERDIAPKYAS